LLLTPDTTGSYLDACMTTDVLLLIVDFFRSALFLRSFKLLLKYSGPSKFDEVALILTAALWDIFWEKDDRGLEALTGAAKEAPDPICEEEFI